MAVIYLQRFVGQPDPCQSLLERFRRPYACLELDSCLFSRGLYHLRS